MKFRKIVAAFVAAAAMVGASVTAFAEVKERDFYIGEAKFRVTEDDYHTFSTKVNEDDGFFTISIDNISGINFEESAVNVYFGNSKDTSTKAGEGSWMYWACVDFFSKECRSGGGKPSDDVWNWELHATYYDNDDGSNKFEMYYKTDSDYINEKILNSDAVIVYIFNRKDEYYYYGLDGGRGSMRATLIKRDGEPTYSVDDPSDDPIDDPIDDPVDDPEPPVTTGGEDGGAANPDTGAGSIAAVIGICAAAGSALVISRKKK